MSAWLVLVACSLMPVAQAEAENASPTQAPAACPSAADMQLLASLHQRRLQLDSREQDLDARQKELDTFRLKLEERMVAMSGELEKFEERYHLGEPARKQREKRVAALVEAMSGLSAKKAAPMLAAAEADLTGDLLMRMGPARTAALLAIMPVQKAARLMEYMGGQADKGEAAAAAAPPAAPPAKAAASEAAKTAEDTPEEKQP